MTKQELTRQFVPCLKHEVPETARPGISPRPLQVSSLRPHTDLLRERQDNEEEAVSILRASPQGFGCQGPGDTGQSHSQQQSRSSGGGQRLPAGLQTATARAWSRTVETVCAWPWPFSGCGPHLQASTQPGLGLSHFVWRILTMNCDYLHLDLFPELTAAFLYIGKRQRSV